MKVKFIILGILVNSYFFDSNNAQTYVDLFTQGQEAYKEGDLSTFMILTEKADSIRPNHRVIMYQLAKAYSLNSRPKHALLVLNKIANFYASEVLLDSTDFKNLVHTNAWVSLQEKIKISRIKKESSELVFEIDKAGIHPEGIEYDEETDIFFITDIRTGLIYKVDSKGALFDEFVDLTELGFWSPMGISIDPLNSDRIWVTTSASPNSESYQSEIAGKAAVLQFDKKNGQLIQAYFPKDDGHLFGDITISDKGDVFVTDSQSPVVFKVDKENRELVNAYASDMWWNLQGLALSDDGGTLYVADYVSGIFSVQLESGEITPLLASNEILRGTDGLYIKGKTMVAIQNGTLPIRVALISLNNQGEAIEETLRYIDQANEHLEEPTLGTWVSNDLYYIGNSPWGYYDDDLTPLLDDWPSIKIMKLDGIHFK